MDPCGVVDPLDQPIHVLSYRSHMVIAGSGGFSLTHLQHEFSEDIVVSHTTIGEEYIDCST